VTNPLAALGANRSQALSDRQSGTDPLDSPKLSAKHVDFFYGQFQALHDVSLNFPANRITALIGPSGCGKSTFLRALNRMHETVRSAILQGSIELDGKDILALNVNDVRKKIGMVFQRSNPFKMSIFHNVSYGLTVNGIAGRDRIGQAVERSLRGAGLWEEVKDKLHQSAHDLSGGQQQRLCIARALVVDPEVLLLDEPCSALDPIATAKVEELLHEMKKDRTVIIVTHNMQQAARVSDFTGFFLLGKLIELDRTEQIFRSPSKKETEDYVTGRFG
jgi:phosphate transport system ATP-binding protein